MILQDWALALGLRYQGALVSAVRGCDSMPKADPSKALVRSYRNAVLVAFSPNPSSFIDMCSLEETRDRALAVAQDFDHYPVHFVLHLMQAAEIIAYKHPDPEIASVWWLFYSKMCRKMHLRPETAEALTARLEATEQEFARNQ